MKLIVSVIAFVLAVGFGVFLVTAVLETEVTINTNSAKGVYNLETKEFNGTVSGWSTGGGFGSALEEIKAAAQSQHSTKVAIGAGGTAVFLVVGLATLVSGLKDRKRKAQNPPQQWGDAQ